MPERASERLERIVRDLLRGRRLAIGPDDSIEKEAIVAAAQLAGAREGHPRMSPSFRRRLLRTLEGGRTRPAPAVSRRTALVAGFGATLGALAGLELGRLSAPPARPVPSIGFSREVIDPRPGRWRDVAALLDLPEGHGVRIDAGAFGAFLFRRGSQVTAVSSVCTHLPCELAWRAERGLLVCPCHDQAFNAEGESTSQDYPLPTLPRVQARVVDGRVQVRGT